MTKLTNEELLDRLQNSGGTALSAYQPIIKEVRAEILKRMAEGAAGSESPQGDLLAALKGVRELFYDGTPFYVAKVGNRITNGDQARIDSIFIALDAAIAKAESGSASTAGPRPQCPPCVCGDGGCIECWPSNFTKEALLEHLASLRWKASATAPAPPLAAVPDTQGPRCPKCQSKSLSLNFEKPITPQDDRDEVGPYVVCGGCGTKTFAENWMLFDFAQFFATQGLPVSPAAPQPEPTFELAVPKCPRCENLNIDVAYCEDGFISAKCRKCGHQGSTHGNIHEFFAAEPSQPEVLSPKLAEMGRRIYGEGFVTNLNRMIAAEAQKELKCAAPSVEPPPEMEPRFEFSPSPCGHSSQYAYTENGGKNIVYLVCEKQMCAAPTSTAEPKADPPRKDGK